MLRKFQKEIKQIGRRIRNGEPIRHIYAHITQGGGKSSVAALLSSELPNYKICWVVPRDSLRQQGEESFINPANKARYGNTGSLRAAKNEPNPSRDTNGYITTYQAIMHDKTLHQSEMEKADYILLLDECHHIPDPKTVNSEEGKSESANYDAIKPLVDRAKIVVYMTGSMERHLGEQLAFIPYKFTDLFQQQKDIDLSPREGWEFVTYSRLEALEEGAVLPFEFNASDGPVAFIDPKTKNERLIPHISRATEVDYSNVINAASAGFMAHEIITGAVESWMDYKRNKYPPAKLLIIAATIELAKVYQGWLREMRVNSMIATSDDTPAARRNILHFKGDAFPECDALVSVAMAYEGLDVVQITHVVCLTDKRSKPWIEQSATRCNRIDYKRSGKDCGYIFTLSDRPMLDIASSINENRITSIVHLPGSPENLTARAEEGVGRTKAEHVNSKVTGMLTIEVDGSKEREIREIKNLFGNNPLIETEARKIFNNHAIVGADRKNTYIDLLNHHRQRGTLDMDSYLAAMTRVATLFDRAGDYLAAEPVVELPEVVDKPFTPAQNEESLLRKIEALVKFKSGRNKNRKIKINKILKDKFGERSTLTESQLKEVVTWLEKH